MRNIIFSITDNEQKVLDYNCPDPQDWIENAVRHVIDVVKDEIYELEVNRILENPNIATMINDKATIIKNFKGPFKGNINQ